MEDLGYGKAYSATVYHAARDLRLRREPLILSLKVPIYLANIVQVRSAFRGYCPSLDDFEDFVFDVVVDSG